MHDDPQLAQARNFLVELRQCAQTLMRRRELMPGTAIRMPSPSTPNLPPYTARSSCCISRSSLACSRQVNQGGLVDREPTLDSL